MARRRTALGALIRSLRDAVASDEDPSREVQRVLESSVAEGRDLLDPALLRPASSGYARRLLHRDPGGRFSLMAMIWGRGQGTPVHDHAGRWCVECVYRGRMRVSLYRFIQESGDGTVTLREDRVLVSGEGQGGSLVPPLEHHRMENEDGVTAVTLHVYAGELRGCNVFHALGGDRYRRAWQDLDYTD